MSEGRGWEIAQQACRWIGTPYHRGQALQQLGCDCAGLVVGILCELEIADYRHELADVPRILPDGYLREKFARYCECVDATPQLQPGDILLFSVGGVEQHAAIYTCEGRMIHTLMTLGQVVEHDLTEMWRKRLTGVFRVREESNSNAVNVA